MKLIFLGDSTMQLNDETTYPQVGWPQALSGRFKQELEVYDLAKNGRSTKSFIEEGLFKEALALIDDSSIVVIEFGHNDEHEHQPERFTRPYLEYKQNLKYMHDECVARGASVLFLTPIYRRNFDETGVIDPNVHKDYREAMIEVAKETKTPYIDMCSLTREAINDMGPELSKVCFMNFEPNIYPNYLEGKSDNTHLRSKGANLVAAIFLQEIIKMNHELSDLLI